VQQTNGVMMEGQFLDVPHTTPDVPGRPEWNGWSSAAVTGRQS
jgi:hypothetical protein